MDPLFTELSERMDGCMDGRNSLNCDIIRLNRQHCRSQHLLTSNVCWSVTLYVRLKCQTDYLRDPELPIDSFRRQLKTFL